MHDRRGIVLLSSRRSESGMSPEARQSTSVGKVHSTGWAAYGLRRMVYVAYLKKNDVPVKGCLKEGKADGWHFYIKRSPTCVRGSARRFYTRELLHNVGPDSGFPEIMYTHLDSLSISSIKPQVNKGFQGLQVKRIETEWKGSKRK